MESFDIKQFNIEKFKNKIDYEEEVSSILIDKYKYQIEHIQKEISTSIKNVLLNSKFVIDTSNINSIIDNDLLSELIYSGIDELNEIIESVILSRDSLLKDKRNNDRDFLYSISSVILCD